MDRLPEIPDLEPRALRRAGRAPSGSRDRAGHSQTRHVIARDAHRRFGQRQWAPGEAQLWRLLSPTRWRRSSTSALLFVGQDFTHTDVRRVLD